MSVSNVRKQAEAKRRQDRAAQRAAWMFAALIRTPDKIEAAPLDQKRDPKPF